MAGKLKISIIQGRRRRYGRSGHGRPLFWPKMVLAGPLFLADYNFLAHLSRRLIGELIVYRSSRRPSVRPFTFSNMNISATSWPIGMKFYLKHHWGGGKTSVDFDPDRIRTLVSMATDSSHRVIMGKTAS